MADPVEAPDVIAPDHAAVGATADDNSLRDNFVKSRTGNAARGAVNDSWIRALEGAPKAVEAVKPPPPVAPGLPPGAPIGMQILHGIKASAKDVAVGVIKGETAVVKDVGLGVLDSPRQIIGGLIDYHNNIMKFADDIVAHAEKAGLPNVYFQAFNKQGKWDPKVMTPDEYHAGVAAGTEGLFQLPTTGGSEQVTGRAIRAITTFLAAKKPAAAAEGGVVGNVFSDAFAGATGVDPNDKRLSNTVDAVVPNAITDWLKVKPEDEGTFLGRIKSGLEYAGLGQAVSGVVSGLRAGKDWWQGLNKSSLDSTAAPAIEGTAPRAGTRVATGAADDVVMATGGHQDESPGGAQRRPVAGAARTAKEHVPDVAADAAGKAAEEEIDTLGVERRGPSRAPGEGVPPPARNWTAEPAAPQTFLPTSFNPGAPLVTVRTADKLAATDFLAGRPGVNPIKINLDRINTAQDIKDVLAQVSTQLPKNPVQSHETTVALSQQLGLSVEDFLKGYKGANLNAAEVTAMRFVLNDSARQVSDLAKLATDPGTATPQAMATFIKAFSVHRAMEQYAENAANESGRTLNAWGIMAGHATDQAKMVQKLVDNAGADNIKDVARKISELADDPAKVSAFIGQTSRNSGRDGTMFAYYNVILSNPAIILKKLASDAIMGGWNVMTRYAAEKWGQQGAVAPGETSELLHGYMGSFGDGVRAAGTAIRMGESQFLHDYQTMDALHSSRLAAVTDSAPESIGLKPTYGAMEFLKSSLPTSWIGAADDFAKVINYRAALRSLSYREGFNRGLAGDEMATFQREMMANPSEALHDQAVNQALYHTFQEPLTGIGLKLQNAADAFVWPVAGTDYEIPVGRVIAPFIKIPTNIARWSYNNSPLPLALPTDHWKEFMASSPANHDIGMARIGLGTGLGLIVGSAALNGYITGRGPSDPEHQAAWRRAGNEPYSVRNPFDGKWYGYNSIEPTGMYTAAIADAFNIMKFAHDDDRQSIAASVIMGVGQAALSKSYLFGTAQLFEALNDPERKGTSWFDRLGAGMIAPSLGAAARRAQDPWARAHYGFLDDVENRLPYLSEGLPFSRTMWGDPIPLHAGFLPPFSSFEPTAGVARAVSPISVGPSMPVQPIDKWVWDNRDAFPNGPDGRLGLMKPGRYVTFDSDVDRRLSAKVELEPKEHDRYQVLAGNGSKEPHTGLGAKDYLNALLAGTNPDNAAQQMWDTATPTFKSMMVLRVVNEYRVAAKKQLMDEFPRVRQAVEAGMQQRQQAMTPQQ
jgi:hypothetical protein